MKNPIGYGQYLIPDGTLTDIDYLPLTSIPQCIECPKSETPDKIQSPCPFDFSNPLPHRHVTFNFQFIGDGNDAVQNGIGIRANAELLMQWRFYRSKEKSIVELRRAIRIHQNLPALDLCYIC